MVDFLQVQKQHEQLTQDLEQQQDEAAQRKIEGAQVRKLKELKFTNDQQELKLKREHMNLRCSLCGRSRFF
jgi:hypothetical protein